MTLSTVSPIMGFVGDNWSCVDHMSYSIHYHRVFSFALVVVVVFIIIVLYAVVICRTNIPIVG